MNIHLHVQQLILDGITMEPHQHRLLATSVERELVLLLTRHGIGAGVRGGGAFKSIRTGPIISVAAGEPYHLGQQIARSLHGGLIQ